MIRVHALHRRDAGTNALLVLRDTRWTDNRVVVGTMEVDLTSRSQLVYIAPNMMLSINDFYNHMELCIQTHCYENWQGGESNLLITSSLIGRLTDTSYVGFQYNVQNVSYYLASNGIRAVPSKKYSTRELQGRRWVLRPAQVQEPQQPAAERLSTRTDGSVTIRFSEYS